MNVRKFIKRIGMGMLVFPMTFKGYTKGQAKRWWRRKYRDFRENDAGIFAKLWAYRRGFLSSYVESVEIDSSNFSDVISERDYRYIQPLNEKYSKWMNDKISVSRIFEPFDSFFPKCYFHFYVRDGQWHVIADKGEASEFGEDMEGILSFIRAKGVVRLTTSVSNKRVKLSYVDGKFFVNDEEYEVELLKEFIFRSEGGKYRSRVHMITEYTQTHRDFVDDKSLRPKLLKLYVINSEGDNPKIGDAFLIEKEDVFQNFDDLEDDADEQERDNLDVSYASDVSENGNRVWHRVNSEDGQIIGDLYDCSGVRLQKVPCFEEIRVAVSKICFYVPQIEFFGVNVIITENGFKFESLQAIPTYPLNQLFSDEINKYLLERVIEKKQLFASPMVRIGNGYHRISLQVRKNFARLFFPKSLFPYLSVRTISEFANDFFTNKDASFSEKMWAYKHGFQSYRLKQYGITKENYENFISDFEYKWLRHINNKYRTWFEDKVTIKYIFREFSDCFPSYYYHVTLKNGRNKIIPMMDCPDGFGANYDDIFRLARERKVLALKPDEGSHGEGFFKLSYEDGNYYLNDEEASEERIRELLEDVDNQYLITEFIIMHPEIKKIYPGSVNTVRLTVFKKDGRKPYIGNGYMRYGSSRTGGVDNVGAGGIGVDLDVETGYFYNPRTIEDGAILVPCPYHPDTGEKIEGYLPNWDYVRNQILSIAEAVPEVEYFGFDLAITETGIKFPEINRFPDFPRINPLTEETMDYLLYKLKSKKRQYGYVNGKRPFRLINLPKRDS